MVKKKHYLVKGEKKLRVLSFNKQEQTVKVEGALTTFTTSLEKAINNGYTLIKEVETNG